MSAHRGLSFPLNNQCNQNLFLLFSLKTISPTPYKFCLMLSQSLVSHFSLYRLDLHSHAALKTFLLIDEIRWACCPSGVGGSGGSSFSRLPLATSSCISGRKPGLDLQREVIECVFIHDQSLIQKVLGHLDRKQEKGREKFPISVCYFYN